MYLAAPESDSEALDGDSPCPGASFFAQVRVDGEAGSPGPPAIWPQARWSRGLSASPSLPAPPPPRAYKRKERLLIKSFVIFAVCRTAGPSDTHSLAPAARPLGARRLRETPLETCRADKGRRQVCWCRVHCIGNEVRFTVIRFSVNGFSDIGKSTTIKY